MSDYANLKAGNSATGKTPTLWSIKQSLPFMSCILTLPKVFTLKVFGQDPI